MRKLTLRVREQPANFLIVIHQSLTAAQNGENLCRAGLKASKVLLGEEIPENSDRDKERFTTKTLEDMKGSASALNEQTNGIYRRFRELRAALMGVSD